MRCSIPILPLATSRSSTTLPHWRTRLPIMAHGSGARARPARRTCCRQPVSDLVTARWDDPWGSSANDIDLVAGDAAWEKGLFNLCNDVQAANHHLVVAASSSARESGIALPDLESRLQKLPAFHVHALDDPQRVAALQLRATHRGLALPDETAHYLLSRSRRDMASLYELLDKLDFEAHS